MYDNTLDMFLRSRIMSWVRLVYRVNKLKLAKKDLKIRIPKSLMFSLFKYVFVYLQCTIFFNLLIVMLEILHNCIVLK